MKIYSYYGYNDFIICLGYKGYVIKEFFADYYLHMSDITFDFSKENHIEIHNNIAEPWKVTLIDSGLNTQTGGRLRRIRKYIENQTFMMTYGDGVSDVDIKALHEYHKKSGKLATVTAVQPGGRYGVIDFDDTTNLTRSFIEKSKEDGGYINAGFMVLEPEVLDLIDDDSCIFEREPMETLAANSELKVYKHEGFWQCMDTQRDMHMLNDMWNQNNAKWKVW